MRGEGNDKLPCHKEVQSDGGSKEIELSDINKSWLPRIGVYGQVTAHNIVPSFPEGLSDVLQNMGQEMRGMGKIQYKLGIDTQTIWDGGVSKANREMSRANLYIWR